MGLVLLGSSLLVVGFEVAEWDTFGYMEFAGPQGRTMVGESGKVGRSEN